MALQIRGGSPRPNCTMQEWEDANKKEADSMEENKDLKRWKKNYTHKFKQRQKKKWDELVDQNNQLQAKIDKINDLIKDYRDDETEYVQIDYIDEILKEGNDE